MMCWGSYVLHVGILVVVPIRLTAEFGQQLVHNIFSYYHRPYYFGYCNQVALVAVVVVAVAAVVALVSASCKRFLSRLERMVVDHRSYACLLSSSLWLAGPRFL
jgi:hypothetical protein